MRALQSRYLQGKLAVQHAKNRLESLQKDHRALHEIVYERDKEIDRLKVSTTLEQLTYNRELLINAIPPCSESCKTIGKRRWT